MTRLLTKLAFVALAAGALAGQAQAHTQWRFPYKSAPYAVPHDHNDSTTTIRQYLHKHKLGKVQQDKHSAIVDTREIVVAHHKPPYHDGLPRTQRPRNPKADPFGTSGSDGRATTPSLNQKSALA